MMATRLLKFNLPSIIPKIHPRVANEPLSANWRNCRCLVIVSDANAKEKSKAKIKGHVPAEIHDYILAHTREPEILARIKEETLHIPGGTMQITAEQGQFLSLLVKLTKAERCIEVGVFVGYSAICVALSLPENGRIVALDRAHNTMEMARSYAEQAGVLPKIDFRLGQALDSLQKMLDNGEDNSYDFAFIDADKRGYSSYYELLLKLVKPGGLIIVDNVLWYGDVADPLVENKITDSLRSFNDFLLNDDRVDMSMVPVGDGLTLCLKK